MRKELSFIIFIAIVFTSVPSISAYCSSYGSMVLSIDSKIDCIEIKGTWAAREPPFYLLSKSCPPGGSITNYCPKQITIFDEDKNWSIEPNETRFYGGFEEIERTYSLIMQYNDSLSENATIRVGKGLHEPPYCRDAYGIEFDCNKIPMKIAVEIGYFIAFVFIILAIFYFGKKYWQKSK